MIDDLLIFREVEECFNLNFDSSDHSSNVIVYLQCCDGLTVTVSV